MRHFLEIKDTNNLFLLSNLSDTTEDTFSGDNERNHSFTGTTLFISLGLVVGLLTTVMAIVYLKLRSRRPILRRLPRYM